MKEGSRPQNPSGRISFPAATTAEPVSFPFKRFAYSCARASFFDGVRREWKNGRSFVAEEGLENRCNLRENNLQRFMKRDGN